MKLGVRAHDFGMHSAAELAGTIAGFSFAAAQLAVPKAITGVDSYLSLTDSQCEEIARAFGAAGIELSVIGCYIEPSLPDREMRLNQLEVFFAALRASRKLGAKCVGTETTRYSGDSRGREAAFGLLLDSALRMVDAAERENATVAIEPVRDHTLNSPDLTARLLREIGSPRLGIIFDPVNLLSPGLVPSQKTLWSECMDAFGKDILVMHVKDAQIGPSGFVPCALGHGLMDYAEIMSALARLGKDIPLLREEIRPESAASDRAWMQRLISP